MDQEDNHSRDAQERANLMEMHNEEHGINKLDGAGSDSAVPTEADENKIKAKLGQQLALNFQNMGSNKDESQSVSLPSDFNSERVHHDHEGSSHRRSSHL